MFLVDLVGYGETSLGFRCPDGPSHPGRPAPGQGFPSNKTLECSAMSRSQGVLKRSSWSQPISQVRNLCSREALQRPLQTSHIGIPCKHERLNVSLTAFISGKLVLTRQMGTTTCTATGNEARKCSFFSHFSSQVPRPGYALPFYFKVLEKGAE